MSEDGTAGGGDRQGRTLIRQLVDVATNPAAMGLASVVLSVCSLFSLAPAAEIAQLDTADDFGGLPLPGPHAVRISVAIRLAVALLAFGLAMVAARRLSGAGLAPNEGSSWMRMIAGAAMIVGVVAVALNLMSMVDALVNVPAVEGIFNHIGS